MIFEGKNDTLNIGSANLMFKNFEGRQTQYNRKGDRNFCVVIDDMHWVRKLQNAGWNVKATKPRDPEEEPRYYIKVKFSYPEDNPNISRGPTVYLHQGKKVSNLDRDTIALLDDAFIIDADVTIRAREWEVNGKTGVTGYLQTLHVSIEEDAFASKYADNGEDDGHMPF